MTSNRHGITELMRWAALGNRPTAADLDEADVPAGHRAAVLDAVPALHALHRCGDQQGAQNAADQAAARIIAALPAGHGPRREPLPDDPRALATRVLGH
jgi:hypothetical protein